MIARIAANPDDRGHTDAVRFPTPEDPARAPVWDNYLVAQAAQAALGLIPTYVHAMGVEVRGTSVALVVQVPLDAPERDEDIEDISDELSDLVGPDVDVSVRIDAAPERRLSPSGSPVRWFFASRP